MVDTQGDLYGARISAASKEEGQTGSLNKKTIYFPVVGNSDDPITYTYKETIECVRLDSTGNKKSDSYNALGYTSLQEVSFQKIEKKEFPLVRIALETRSSKNFYVISASAYYLSGTPAVRGDCYGYFNIKKSDFSVCNSVFPFVMGRSAMHLSNFSIRELQAIYDGTFMSYGTTTVRQTITDNYKTQFDDFSNFVNDSVSPPSIGIGKIIKLNEAYWVRTIPKNKLPLAIGHYCVNKWDWIKISSSGIVHGFCPKDKEITIDSTQISDEQNFQYDGKTYILLGVKTTGTEIKNNKFPSKDHWGNEMFAPWGMSSQEFCIFSCRDIDQVNPTNPIDCPVNNRIYTCKHDKDDLRFVICQQNDIPYLIYLALPYDETNNCYKLILGVSRIRFHEGHAYLDIKWEFSNKNEESTLPITNCKSVTNFAIDPNGQHLWIVYEITSKGLSTTNAFDILKTLSVKYIYIDAKEIIKRAVSTR